MIDKKQLLTSFLPIAVLQAETPEAVEAVPQNQILDGVVCIRRLPFRIGRESRVKKVNGRIERIERPKLDDREPNNDLYLVDRGHLLNISREHLRIEFDGDCFVLVDRGSACGTKINDEPVGGEDQGGSKILRDGDVIIIGTKESPYRYRFFDLRGFEVKQCDR
ncbi:MAG: FHA domain-containing protein [Desulfofustis sp.]|nr:FHA domain-containing protein [Desulfofustis sp.]